MENSTNPSSTHPPVHPKGKLKPKFKAVLHKKPVANKPLNTKPMAGSGYDDSVCWTIELAGMSLGAHNGTSGMHLPTARQNILVRLRWNRVKITNAVTKADVKLEQIGHGYDKIDYEGSDTPDAEHGRSIRWFQHTIVFEIAFHTVASPIGINLGQTMKLDGLEKINSSFAGTISGWYDIVSGTNGLEVHFL